LETFKICTFFSVILLHTIFQNILLFKESLETSVLHPSHIGTRYGSGSVDPYLVLTDPAPDPALFVSDLQEANKTKIISTFFAYYGTF